MKHAPTGFLPGAVSYYNGAETASSHAVKVDEYSTYMAASYKNAAPVQAVSAMGGIYDAGYTDDGWADFMLWVPPFTRFIGFEFRAIGCGTLTISTPDNATNKNDIRIKVDNATFKLLLGNEFSTSGASKRVYMELMESTGQWYVNGPPMPNPDVANQDRAIIAPFLDVPAELYVRVVASNDGDKSRVLYVLPFQFYFYPPHPTEVLTDAS